MSSPGFHWFVAWRYLMARPRRVSTIIVGFTLGAIAVCLAAIAALMIAPLCDPRVAIIHHHVHPGCVARCATAPG